MDNQDGHGPIAVYYDAIRRENVLECHCGYTARGLTWGEVGEDMDAHLEDADA